MLTRELANRGCAVRTIDNGLTSSVFVPGRGVSHIQADVRDVDDWRAALRGVDAVVHLAAIVGDPACAVDHDLAWETNYLATVHLAEACRAEGVGRFVFASTCSNYGASSRGPANTGTPLHPQSVYAETKIHAEHHLLSQRDHGCAPVILRFATLHGLSPRMRFDLAVNVMTAHAALTGRLTVHGGEQWRPFLHVRDAAQAVLLAVTGTTPGSRPRIYNCGSDRENYRLLDVGAIIAKAAGGAAVVVEEGSKDLRDYRVDFSAIHEELGFTASRSVATGVRELVSAINSGEYHDFTDLRYSDHELVLASVGARAPGAVVRAKGSWPHLVFYGG